MAGEWRTATVRQLVGEGILERPLDGNHGELHPKTGDFVERGIPFIMASDLVGGRVDLTQCAFISEERARSLRKGFSFRGDILISHKATMGRTAIVGELYTPFIMLTPQVTYYRVKDASRLDRQYLKFYFDSPEFQRLFDTWGQKGSTRAYLGISAQLDLPVTLPPLPEQHAIAHILGTLDDKIELNRRMNETLESMARALFDSWFVDVGPDRARASALIADGILEMGDGYRAKNSELRAPGLPFIRAADLNNGFDTHGADVLCADSVAKAGAKTSRPGDVAFTSKGTIGRFARVTEHTQPFVYSPQVCFWRSLDHRRLQPSVLYCWMQSPDLRDQIDAVAGQTDMAPYVSLKDQRQMEVPVFPKSQQEVGARIDALLARQAVLSGESRTLAVLRDTLLPKLISGELRVSDGPCLLSEATR